MPGFDEDLATNNDALNIHSNEAVNAIDEITDKELTELIETALKEHDEEEIIWIYKEFLLFINDISGNPRKNFHGFERLKGFSSFNEIKQDFFQSINKIKSREEVNKFLTRIEKNKKYILFKTLREIKDNERLCTFIFNFMKNKKIFNFEYHNNIYLHLTHLYFTKDTHSSRKNEDIEEAISSFNEKIKLKNKNSSKKLEDEVFLKWAYAYLKRLNDDFNKIEYIPINKRNHQILITTYLDYFWYSNEISYENLMNKLNKAWSQKKFRDSDKLKKKLYHLPLTKKAKEELKKLSDFKNLPETDILESSIHQLFLKEMCDENGKLKY